MSDDVSEVPRDLAGRLADMEQLPAERAYSEASVSALPAREELPACRLCGGALSPTDVYVNGEVAVAVRAVCPDAEAHDAGKALSYLYEVATRRPYPERWQPVDGADPPESTNLTLTVSQFRQALERAAGGEPVDDVVREFRDERS